MMNRLWPTVGRALAFNRAEIFQQGARVYTPTNYGPNVPVDLHQSYHNWSNTKNQLSSSVSKTQQGSYLKVVTRTLSGETVHFTREYSCTENETAHSILCSLPAYQTTTNNHNNNPLINVPYSANVLKDCRNFGVCDSTDLVTHFINVSLNLNGHSAELSKAPFSHLCNSLSGKLIDLSDENFIKVLSAMTHWTASAHASNKHYDNLRNSIVATCNTKIKHWNTTQSLLVADYCYTLNIPGNGKFYRKLHSNLGDKLSGLSSSQLVQFLFYANLNRERPHSKWNLENKIIEEMEQLSADELAIVCMSLFKSKTRISSATLLNRVSQILIDHKDTLSHNSISSLLKILRFSFPGTAQDQCYAVLDALSPHIPQYNSFVWAQLAMFGNSLLVYHEDVIDKLAESCSKNMSSLRLKDIEKLTYCLMLYKSVPKSCPNIYQDIINELRQPKRLVEINHFPASFICCVSYLACANWFASDLISAVFQPHMVKLVLEDPHYFAGRLMSELHWNMMIEGPSNYLGYFLDAQANDILTRKFVGRVPSPNLPDLTRQEKLLLEVNNKLNVLLSTSTAACVNILPHHSNPDIVFCTDGMGTPVDIPAQFFDQAQCSIKVPMYKEYGLVWNAVVVAGQNSLLIPKSCGVRGNLQTKMRQLSKLGYQVSVITANDFSKKAIKHKFLKLESVLASTSSLNVTGRGLAATDIYKQVHGVSATN